LAKELGVNQEIGDEAAQSNRCFGLYYTMHELFIYQPSALRLLNGPSVSSLLQHLTAGAGQLWTPGLRKASRRKTNLHEDPVTHQTESAFGGTLSLCSAHLHIA